MEEIHQTLNKLYAQLNDYVGELVTAAKRQPENIIDVKIIENKKICIKQLGNLYALLASYQRYVETKTRDLSESYLSDIYRLEAIINDDRSRSYDGKPMQRQVQTVPMHIVPMPQQMAPVQSPMQTPPQQPMNAVKNTTIPNHPNDDQPHNKPQDVQDAAQIAAKTDQQNTPIGSYRQILGTGNAPKPYLPLLNSGAVVTATTTTQPITQPPLTSPPTPAPLPLPLPIVPNPHQLILTNERLQMSKVYVSQKFYLMAKRVSNFNEISNSGELYYVEPNNHFAIKIAGKLFHGNIGHIYTNEKEPSKIKECKYRQSCIKADCDFYHDPLVSTKSQDTRNYIATSWQYIPPSNIKIKYAAGYSQYRRFGSRENIEVDIEHISEEETRRFHDQSMHSILCSLILHMFYRE